jgi:methanethiol S-methyltransferase
MKEHFILAVMWIAYCALHSFLAHIKVKRVIKGIIRSWYKYYRFSYVIFSFAGLFFLIWYHLNVPVIEVFRAGTILNIIGVILGFSGLLLMLVCIRKYFMSLSGLRSLLYNEAKGELMITGIHSYVRHPLYLATFAFIWGVFILIPQFSVLIVNTIITFYTLIGIYLEEEKLEAEFGEKYNQYRQKVPGLWPSWRSKKNFERTNG